MALRDRLLVTIGGRKYSLDFAKTSIMPIPITREQQLTDDAVGDRALTGNGLWQVSQNGWELGAGQDYLGDDETDSNKRYDTSAFLDPWDRRRLRLLPELNIAAASAASTLGFLRYGGSSRLYWFNGTDIQFATDPGAASPTWSTVTLTASDVVDGMAADDDYLYFVKHNGATYSLNRSAVGSTTAAGFGALTPTNGPWLCHGRLLAADDNRLYEVDNTGAVPVGNLDYTHSLDDWEWTHALETPNGIYVTGWHASTRSDKTAGVFFVGIDPDDGSLLSPVLATPLPRGERPYSLGFNGGYVLIGLSRGFRVAVIDSNDKLRHGQLVEINGGCREFAPYGRYVWTTYLDDAGAAGGAARIDLGAFVDENNLVPAWAPDRMRTASNAYGTSVFVDAGEVYVTINGVGFCNEVTAVAATGELVTSVYDFLTFEPKAISALSFACEPLPQGASIEFEVAGDDETWYSIVTYDTVGGMGPDQPEAIGAFQADPQRQIRVRITLTRGTTTSDTPELREWRLYAAPAPFAAKEIVLGLRIRDRATDDTNDVEIPYDTFDEWEYLNELETSRQVIAYAVGGLNGYAYVTGVGIPEQGISKWNDANEWFDAVVLVRLVTVNFPAGSVPPLEIYSDYYSSYEEGA